MIPEFKQGMTYGEILRPAMAITDPDEANAFFAAYVQHLVETYGKPQEEAESVVRTNLGYWAGYYDNETRARVERLFCCAHPFFGAIAEKAPPTAEEALEMGKRRGELMAKGSTST